MQWSIVGKQGHINNSINENLITMWCRSRNIFYNLSKKDIGINFPNYIEPKESFVVRISNLQENFAWIREEVSRELCSKKIQLQWKLYQKKKLQVFKRFLNPRNCKFLEGKIKFKHVRRFLCTVPYSSLHLQEFFCSFGWCWVPCCDAVWP